MKEPPAAGASRGWAARGLLGSGRAPAAERGAGRLLAVAGAAVGEMLGLGGSWGALASCLGAAVVAGGPFRAPGTEQSRCRRGLGGGGWGCRRCCKMGGWGPQRQPLTPPWWLW